MDRVTAVRMSRAAPGPGGVNARHGPSPLLLRFKRAVRSTVNARGADADPARRRESEATGPAGSPPAPQPPPGAGPAGARSVPMRGPEPRASAPSGCLPGRRTPANLAPLRARTSAPRGSDGPRKASSGGIGEFPAAAFHPRPDGVGGKPRPGGGSGTAVGNFPLNRERRIFVRGAQCGNRGEQEMYRTHKNTCGTNAAPSPTATTSPILSPAGWSS